MRKSYFAIIALGALVIASCQKENSAVLPKVDSPVFTATLDTDSDTKTVLDNTGKKSLWNQDHIWILNGDKDNAGWKKEYQTDATSSSTATFTESNNEVSLGEGPVVAVCPASPAGSAWWNASVDKIVNKLWLKPVQTAEAGGYDPEAHIAVAYSETTSLEFKNAVSLLKFTVASDNVTEVCVYANGEVNAAGGENVLSGNFSFNTETKKVTTPTGDGISINKYVKVKGTFEKGNTYYIACLPTKFTSGFTVEVVSKGVKGQDKTTEKVYTLERNKILDLGTIEYVATNKQTVYLYPGPWTRDNAVLSVYYWGDGEGWADFADANGDGLYDAQIPIGVTKCHYIRSNPAKPQNWDGVWNRYDDLDLTQLNCITVTDNNGFQYSTSKVE